MRLCVPQRERLQWALRVRVGACARVGLPCRGGRGGPAGYKAHRVDAGIPQPVHRLGLEQFQRLDHGGVARLGARRYVTVRGAPLPTRG
eukprot:1612021-Pleurochrysis_carterae.AAC.2